MINQFYLDLYPILTEEWRDLESGFGGIRYDLVVPALHKALTSRLYIQVGNNWTKVGLEVRHKIHGVAAATLGDAKRPAHEIWQLVKQLQPGVEAEVLQEYEAWAEQLKREVPNRSNQ